MNMYVCRDRSRMGDFRPVSSLSFSGFASAIREYKRLKHMFSAKERPVFAVVLTDKELEEYDTLKPCVDNYEGFFLDDDL